METGADHKYCIKGEILTNAIQSIRSFESLFCIYEQKCKGSYFCVFGLAFVLVLVDIFGEASSLPSCIFTVFLLKNNKK